MHRLEPVARVRQRPMHDGRERVGEITLLERLAQRDLLHVAGVGGNHFLVHRRQEVARSWPVNKEHFQVAQLVARLLVTARSS